MSTETLGVGIAELGIRTERENDSHNPWLAKKSLE
jgi:hypothetical protein